MAARLGAADLEQARELTDRAERTLRAGQAIQRGGRPRCGTVSVLY